MNRLLTISALLLALLLLNTCSWWEPEVMEFEDIEAEIGREVSENGIVSLSAWVIKDDRVAWSKSYGHTQAISGSASDENTIYDLASVTKLVVVTAVMQLEEQGLIDLQADINNYLPFQVRNPRFPDKAVTVYHLITHASGLNWPEDEQEVPGFYDNFPLDENPLLAEWLPQFILPGGSFYVDQVWMKHAPGERELYSNIGINLAAYVVEVVSETDFNEYCKQHIFQPLEMYNTSFFHEDLDLQRVAVPYSFSHAPMDFQSSRGYASGDLKSSTEDFSHFILAYMNGGLYQGQRILKQATVDRIMEIQNPATGLCLVWNCTVGEWFGHAGGEEGVSAYVEIHPSTQTALMVVTNRHHSLIYPGNKIHALIRRKAREL